jgi:hypothetical protein
MAVRNIAVTDTIEKFRTEFNAMTLNDFGDIANLDASLSATNLVDAMNETLAAATNTAGFRIEDSSSTQQLISGGDVLRVFGTTNEIEAVVSATDRLTIGLPSAVSVTTSLTAPTLTTGNLSLTNGSITDSSGSIAFGDENLSTTGNISGANITGTGSTHTLGTVEISGNSIRSTDSTQLEINDSAKIVGPLVAGVTTINPAGSSNITSSTGFTVFDSTIVLQTNRQVVFEGATDDAFEVSLNGGDPTADRTITLPDETGTLITTGATDLISETMMANDAISQNELKDVVTLVIYNSSGTPVKTLYGAGS